MKYFIFLINFFFFNLLSYFEVFDFTDRYIEFGIFIVQIDRILWYKNQVHIVWEYFPADVVYLPSFLSLTLSLVVLFIHFHFHFITYQVYQNLNHDRRVNVLLLKN